MHRSGTSLVARAVNLLGWSLGDEDELIPPADDNPKGFWESSPIVSFNDLLLSRLGGSWDAPPSLPSGWEHSEELPTPEQAGEMLDRVFGDVSRRGWKDPRTSLLIPYWQRVIEIEHSIIVLRHPLEVAGSLSARSRIDSDWSHYLWLRYTAAAVSSAIDPTLVIYDEVLADPARWFETLGTSLGITVSPEAHAAFLEHADPALRHHERPAEPTSDLGTLAVEVFESLKSRSAEPMQWLDGLARAEFSDTGDARVAAMATVHDQLSRTRTAVAPLVPLQARTRSMARTLSRTELRSNRLARERDRLAADLEAAKTAKGEAQAAMAKAIQSADERELALREHLAKSNSALAVARQRAKKAERNLRRLKGRRSVRLALRAADLVRPAFRLRRRQRNRQSARGRDRGPVPRARRLTDVQSPFHDRVRPLVEDGSRDLIKAWDASEDVIDALSSTGTGSEPLVSIVMPTWNRRDVIGDAITSVLAQTYENWELLVCDDGSEDNTRAAVRRFKDDRIHYRLLPKGGAARARNAGLAESRGELIAYLDSDNVWHPRFLETQVAVMEAHPGRWCAYSKYLDVIVDGETLELSKFSALPFHYDRLSKRNFIDLNTVVHRRVLYEELGGFDESLVRQQDWDLLLKYAFLRDPFYIDSFLLLYRRNQDWDQITYAHKGEPTAPATIAATVAGYYTTGLPTRSDDTPPSLSIVTWDICRNHFSKAYNLAEAAAERMDVRLVGFRFFDEPIFQPYANATPDFKTNYFDGGDFPTWASALARAVAVAGRSDVVYAVKPRLPSLGVALLANHNFARPIVLESNDLEAVVTTPRPGQEASPPIDLASVDPADPGLLNPYGDLWTGIMEGLAARIPLRATHNSVLDNHFGGGAIWIRNPKDERHYDPTRHDRSAVRRRLGFGDTDRVILFGGMVRRHKGVFDLLPLLDAHPDYRLLVVGSRSTPDEARLREQAGERVTFVEAVDRNEMAAINLASDAVVLWLDPTVPASQYQMPYKLTDALAMGVPVVANDIGDLGRLAQGGFLRLAEFGDQAALADTLDDIFKDQEATDKMTAAGRRLYIREFSYDAVRHNLAMIGRTAMQQSEPLEVAGEFAEFFSRFYSTFSDQLISHGEQR